jgi:hypothetical protein
MSELSETLYRETVVNFPWTHCEETMQSAAQDGKVFYE